METLEQIIERWNTNEGKPYKGRLIDWNSYGGDGTEPPTNIGCMCAQGQVLHLLGGWTPQKLRDENQIIADREVARLLNISFAHSILLRKINDSIDGAPATVLTHPEKILGDQARIILAFWRHLDRMTSAEWTAARNVDWNAADVIVSNVAGTAAAYSAGAAVGTAAAYSAGVAAGVAVGINARIAAWDATTEIQDAKIMREQGTPFFFLPLFGFNDPSEIPLED